MKKFVLFALGFLVVMFVGRTVLVPKLSERGFQTLVTQNIGLDPTVGLEDGLHVYLCGAGSPLPDPQRSGPCIGVLAGDRAFVIDAGTGGARNLGPMGFPTGRIERIFLTHLHSDHIDGLGEMLLGSWINGARTRPTPVFGPVGTAQIVNGFNTAYRIDAGYRTAHHGRDIAHPDGFGAVATEIEMTSDHAILLDEGDLKITVFNVSHAPVHPAFGYRIDYKDRSVAITGDTVYDLNIVSQSTGVDVLFHEALNMEMVQIMEAGAKARGAERLAKILYDIRDYHTSPVEAAKVAKAAEAQELVLYHIVPPLPRDALVPVFLKGVNKAYDGKVTVSKDGLIIRMPSESDAIIHEYGRTGI